MIDAEKVIHPLFPLGEDADPDDDPPDVQEIMVQRKENGRMVTAPRTFYPNELTTLLQLHGEYGGGEYHLTARNNKKQFQGRVMHVLPGASKPMFDDGKEETAPSKPAAPPSPFGMPAQPGGDGGIMGLIMMMMQSMMQSSAAAQQQQTQMFLAMMSNSTQTTAADKAAQQETYNRQREQDRQHSESMMLMMKELSSARQAGNSTGGEESFFKGVEFMRHFATQQLEAQKAAVAGGAKSSDFDLEGVIGTVLEALQGFNAFREMSSGAIPGATVPAVAAAS